MTSSQRAKLAASKHKLKKEAYTGEGTVVGAATFAETIFQEVEKVVFQALPLRHPLIITGRHPSHPLSYMKIGGRVAYRVADIEAFERDLLDATSDQGVTTY